MTNDEIDLAVGQAVRKKREAEKRLVCLEAKITDMRRVIHTVTWLFDGKREAGKLTDGKIPILKPGQSTPDEYADWPTAEHIVNVLAEIEDTKAEIERLSKIIET